MRYRAEVDGLRAIAVVSVLCYHAGLGFQGGYVGVDIFFVISGYLVTGILLKDIRTEEFSYTQFWMRRINRLVPALFLMTAVTASLGSIVLLPKDLVDLAGCC